jgi:hypothetical protein
MSRLLKDFFYRGQQENASATNLTTIRAKCILDGIIPLLRIVFQEAAGRPHISSSSIQLPPMGVVAQA